VTEIDSEKFPFLVLKDVV